MLRHLFEMTEAKFENKVVSVERSDEVKQLEDCLHEGMRVISISGPIVRCINMTTKAIVVTNKKDILNKEIKE